MYAYARAHTHTDTYIDACSEEGRGGSKEADRQEHVQRFQSLYAVVCQAGAKYASMSAERNHIRDTNNMCAHIHSFALALSIHHAASAGVSTVG